MRTIEKTVTKKVYVNVINREDFKIWLQKRGAFEKFITNMFMLSCDRENILYSFKDKPHMLIMGGFFWEDALEGFEYWRDLSDSWKEYCEKHKIEEIEA